ncbi:uncharacterized protein BDW43DRAFT_279957 [Aspergillus alliaceus]|uniref:uncharacterized protein n=1 Tax=Petromyces alliaceus TaxID=209559 RepID=UPI0012A6C2E0|nr:uncharacterized protein BDW43DRAFT_279957 [Aspergillus alliaceus]KAB8232302.1 hypothetical protein BDW43DRAFT_279957 [Aspergillus alliaceus]
MGEFFGFFISLLLGTLARYSAYVLTYVVFSIQINSFSSKPTLFDSHGLKWKGDINT